MFRGSKRRAWRRLKIGILAGFVLAALLVVWLTGLASLRITLAELETGARANLAVQTAVLERLLDKFRLLSPLLARERDSGEPLIGTPAGTLAGIGNGRAPGITAIAAAMSGAEEIWVMDPAGRVVVSSRMGVPDGAIGGASRIPVAFTQALQGQLGRQLIPGTPERPSNYVFASPLRKNDRVAGVLAVRVSLADVEQAWALSKDSLLALDTFGRVVVSNKPEWRGRGVGTLDAGRDIGAMSVWERLLLLLPTTPSAGYHLSLEEEVAVLGWRVRSLVAVEDARQRSGWAMLVALLACVIAAGGIAVLIARRGAFMREDRRRRAEALRLERRVKSRTADLRKANVRLEREVREREQAEASLRQTQAELVQAAKLATLGRMSAALSHEYNQPLAAIRSDAEVAGMLIERGRAGEAKANLTRIEGMVARMAEIAKTLKGFTRKSGTDIRPVSLRKVIDEATLLVQPQIKQSGVCLELDLPEADVIVAGGHIRLEQVVINLLSNAFDAVAGVARPQVLLRLRREDGFAVLSVADNGPGIGADDLPQIFDPFFTTKDVGAGLGLGLSIAYKIVHDFSGSLRAGNGEGGGAVFTMRLPVAGARVMAAE